MRSHRTGLVIALVMMTLGASTIDALEHGTALTEAPWAAAIRRVDDALAAKKPVEALKALDQAHLAALGSRRWDGMLAVGDVARRVGPAVGAARVYDARARQAYLVALFRARHEGSLDGVLRVAVAFSSLGDTEVVEQCLHIARDLLVRKAEDPRKPA